MKIVATILTILLFQYTSAQQINKSSADTLGLSSELKAMVIGGGSAFTLTTVFAALINSGLGSDEKADAIMIPGAGVAMAVPAGLISAGLGYLFGSRHHSTDGGFRLGVGYAGSTVDHNVSRAQDSKNWYHGYQIHVATPRMGPIRYDLSYTRYETFEYVTFDEPAESSYWELNLNMHYLVKKGRIELYPFLGSNLFRVHNKGLYYYEGDRYDETFTDLGFNIGMGFSLNLTDHISIYSEPKLTIAEDIRQWYFSLGSSYEF